MLTDANTLIEAYFDFRLMLPKDYEIAVYQGHNEIHTTSLA